MTTAHEGSDDMIGKYLATVRAGLKRLDEGQQGEILAEIRSHLTDRIEQLKQQGSARPTEDALAAMGDPDEISKQFSDAAVVRTSSRSNLPWVLLRAASRLAFTGLRGALVFTAGLIGYGTAISFMAAAVAKQIVPARIGFWVGPHTGVIWGYPGNTLGAHELAGHSFAYISIALAFLCASGTTLLLKQLLRSWRSARETLPPGPGLTAHSAESR
jgi:uncharacterized membrane protein